MKLKPHAMRLSINCLRIMIKRLHSCAFDRPSSRLVMQRGTYESSGRAAGERGKGWRRLQPPLRARAICYFALSVTHSLIKRPPLVARPRHFSSPRQHTTRCDWRPLYFTFFHLCFWFFFCLVIHPRCIKRFKTARRIRERRDFVKGIRASEKFALRKTCLATIRNANTVLQGDVL